MELFSVLISLWRIRLHLGLALEQAGPGCGDDQPAGPVAHLAPLDSPMEVVIDDSDRDLRRDRLGFR